MKTIQEIINTLKQCFSDDYETNCEKCIYFIDGKQCRNNMIKDTIFYLQKKEEDDGRNH